MSRRPTDRPPEPHTMVLIKLPGREKVRAGYWTGYDWDIPAADQFYRHVECWWPIPTAEQLDNLHDYAVVGHKGETCGSMGPFLVGRCAEDYEGMDLDDDPMNMEIGHGAENG